MIVFDESAGIGFSFTFPHLTFITHTLEHNTILTHILYADL